MSNAPFVQIAAADGYLYALDALGQVWRFHSPEMGWELLSSDHGDVCCREDFSGPCRHHMKPVPGIAR